MVMEIATEYDLGMGWLEYSRNLNSQGNILLHFLHAKIRQSPKKLSPPTPPSLPNKVSGEGVHFFRECILALESEKQSFCVLRQEKINWTPEDITSVIYLISVSVKAYKFSRNKLHYPLPHTSTINISSKITFDRKNELAHNYAHILMTHGLLGKWNQPIYYYFDKPMIEDILKDVIVRVEERGFKVVAIVSDMEGWNRTVWKKLGITTEKVAFVNPYDNNRSIFAFTEVRYLIKLAKNYFLDKGFTMFSTHHYLLMDTVLTKNTEIQFLTNSVSNDLAVDETLSPTTYLP
ncbi:hypothetical protein PR048_031935 [Dryococelus australis]|uniref:Transposable element P transposase-like RNase H domain-containing protein n=1 Tax=Dryococelus australis TaxID=614101 RepID=A0ABQ9GAQ6_9NEOP|nr:hypothetical protein PR048_031935 [Dryococelus australis]